MRCQDARLIIDALSSPEGSEAGLDRHVALCPDCRRELDRHRALLALLHASAGAAECPDLAPGVLKRLDALSPWPKVWRWAAAALLAAGFMGLGYLVGRWQSASAATQPAPDAMMASYGEALNTVPLASFERAYAEAPPAERASSGRTSP